MKLSAAKLSSKYSSILICTALIIILSFVGNLLTGGQFATLSATIKFGALTALFSLGQMIILCVGGYNDLSVGYCATLVSCITAGIMDGQNKNLIWAILLALAIGLIVGLVNGFLSVYLKLPSLVVTLATSQILQGFVDIYSAGTTIGGKPSPVLKWLAGRQTGNFPNIAFLLIALIVLVTWLMKRTKVGSLSIACGENSRTAYLSGVKVNKVRMLAFITCDIIAALMGLLLLGNLGMAFKDMASSYVMPSIAAVVIGGVSITGGQQNYIGVVLGALVLQTLTNLFVSLGYGDGGKFLGGGAILLLMLIVYSRQNKELT